MRNYILKLSLGLTLLLVGSLVLWSWWLPGQDIETAERKLSPSASLGGALPEDAISRELTLGEQLDQEHQELKVEMKKTDLKMDKLSRKQREMAALELELETGLQEELARLQADLSALPDGKDLLDPSSSLSNNDGLSGIKRLETREWQAVMTNYERETGISRAEAESILRQQ